MYFRVMKPPPIASPAFQLAFLRHALPKQDLNVPSRTARRMRQASLLDVMCVTAYKNVKELTGVV